MFARQLTNKSFSFVKVWHDNCNTYINTINIKQYEKHQFNKKQCSL